MAKHKITIQDSAWFYFVVLPDGRSMIDKASFEAHDKCIKTMKKRKVLEYNDERPNQVKVIGNAIKIGRNNDCDIVLNDSTVSKEHCLLTKKNGSWFIHDLKSTNGTFIKEPTSLLKPRTKFEKVEVQKIKSGTKIKVGTTILLFD